MPDLFLIVLKNLFLAFYYVRNGVKRDVMFIRFENVHFSGNSMRVKQSVLA